MSPTITHRSTSAYSDAHKHEVEIKLAGVEFSELGESTTINLFLTMSPRTYEESTQLKRHRSPITVMTFNHDGSLLASGGDYLFLWVCASIPTLQFLD